MEEVSQVCKRRAEVHSDQVKKNLQTIDSNCTGATALGVSQACKRIHLRDQGSATWRGSAGGGGSVLWSSRNPQIKGADTHTG